MIAIGLMSGTSLDGIDAVLVDIKEEKFQVLKFVTSPYSQELKEKIFRNAQDETAKLSEVCSLNVELAYLFKDAVDLLLMGTTYSYQDIDFIASHGQTIWHQPKKTKELYPSTFQIGEASVLAYETGIRVVSNFRAKDMAAGGEGAPLVPMSEFMLFRDHEKNRALQNIGGIGNVTYIPKNAKLEEVVAFDTGPGNMMIDYFVSKYTQKPFDESGAIAQSGNILESVLEELKKDDFLMITPPKSTGRERYSKVFLDRLSKKMNFEQFAYQDIIRTISEYTVYSMVYHYKKYLPAIDQVIVSGGGSHNQYLMNRLKEELSCEVFTGDEMGFFSDAKEAVAFVVLGYLTITNQYGNVPTATGAKEQVILGSITPGKVEKHD